MDEPVDVLHEDLFHFPEGTETPIRDARDSNIIDFNPLENYEHIRAECLRRGSLYEDGSFGQVPWYYKEKLEWVRPHDIQELPVFKPRYEDGGKPSRFDCLQGDVANCWLISSIQAMTLCGDLFDHVVPDDQSFDNSVYCGAFHFRIWQQGNWYDVVVDDRLPAFIGKGLKGAISRDGDIFWGSLLEKALAKVYAREKKTTPSYVVIEAGPPCVCMQDLSGGITERIRLGKDMIERVHDHMGKSLRDLMLESFERNDMMVVGITDVEEKDEAQFTGVGIQPQHTYSVSKIVWFDPEQKHWNPDWNIDFDKVKDMCLVRLMNPWGYGEWTGAWGDKSEKWREIFTKYDEQTREAFGVPIREDGEFWMELSEFASIFHWMYLCNLEPTGFLLNRNIHIDYKTWHTAVVRGEWVEGLTAWGPDITMRHENPQFLFRFEDPVPGVEEYKRCKSVIDITDRAATRDDSESTSFFVYFGIREKLTQADLQKNSPEHENLRFQFDNSNWQSFLVPGWFIIIPCTMEPKIESKFLMRIFSPCPLQHIDDSGSKIGIPLHLEEQSSLESNEIPMRMFIDSAQGNGEIDWVGLKKILEEAFNPNGSFFGMFLTLLKNVHDYFNPNILRSADEYGNDSVIFTKDECRRMIAMLDEDHSGKLNISEFCNLWKQICFWIKVYDRYKDKEKGYLKTVQLRDALGAIGYNINKRILHTVSYVYSNQQGVISYTDFILCGVSLETTLSLVEEAGVVDKSKITFTLEEWVKKTLIL